MPSVGLDVHTVSIAVASVAKDHDADVLYLGTIGTRQADIDPLGQRQSNATHLVCVYEAGPCGDWLSRDLTHKGHHGWVVTPSLILQKAGDHVNTVRRDAVQMLIEQAHIKAMGRGLDVFKSHCNAQVICHIASQTAVFETAITGGAAGFVDNPDGCPRDKYPPLHVWTHLCIMALARNALKQAARLAQRTTKRRYLRWNHVTVRSA
jgi:hypothetical protein